MERTIIQFSLRPTEMNAIVDLFLVTKPIKSRFNGVEDWSQNTARIKIKPPQRI